MRRRALALTFIAGVGCGKQLNPDFCDAHPADDRCLGGATIDAPRDAAPLGACPAGYDVTLTGSTSRYRVVDSTDSWNNAAADCANDQTTGPYTHLIVVSNDAERQGLSPHADRERHLGHSDEITEGTWLPITTEPDVYPGIETRQVPPWESGEPNGSGNCAIINNALDLRDRDCSNDSQAYICECDAFPVDPDNF